LLQEIEQKAAFSQQQIGLVKAQIAAKNRESRMLELTKTEVESLPKDTNVYEGVGKM
jgi:prefoldin subunit 1